MMRKVGGDFLGFLLLLTILLSSQSLRASDNQEPIRYSESGTLLEYVNDNAQYTVTIDEKSFDIVKEGVLVVKDGRPTELKELSLPVKVKYEYMYELLKKNTMRPVIVYIEAETRR